MPKYKKKKKQPIEEQPITAEYVEEFFGEVPANIQKKEDYLYFLSCIRDGLWQSNKYLAEICSVSIDTITEWKRTPQALAARRKASDLLRKDFQLEGNIDKRLAEAGLQIEATRVDITTQGKPLLGGTSIAAFAAVGAHVIPANNSDTKDTTTD